MPYNPDYRPLLSIDDFLSHDSSGLARSILEPCPLCGRKHPIPFNKITLGHNTIQEIPELVQTILGRPSLRPVVVYDQTIETIIMDSIIGPLRNLGMKVVAHAMVPEPGHLLDSAVINGNQAAQDIGESADILIGAGSGVINDLTKWISTKLNKPFIVCGTAPSMNGYTSITATITEDDIKVSKFLNPSNAIIMDIDIMTQAPMPMIHAGIGDLAARAICNADWKLSQLIKKTKFCPLPYLMTAQNEKLYLGAAPKIAKRDPDAMRLLSEAILLSGLSMTVMEGETSPSSGAEHVISHFWDLLVHLRGLPKNFHGKQVGVGTIIMLNAYQYLREIDPTKLDPAKIRRNRPSIEEFKTENLRLYGDKASSFNDVLQTKWIPDGKYETYIKFLLDSWESIWNELDPYVASVETIKIPFEQAGVPYHLADVSRTQGEAREALLHGNQYRPRYTALDLFWELGLFPEAADIILDRSGVL